MKNLLFLIAGGLIGYSIANSSKNNGKSLVVDDKSNAIDSIETNILRQRVNEQYFYDKPMIAKFNIAINKMFEAEKKDLNVFFDKYYYSTKQSIPQDLYIKIKFLRNKYNILTELDILK